MLQILFIAILSLATSILIRPEVDHYFLFILFAQLSIGEMMVRMKYRASLSCPNCGFDPVVYKRDYKKARALVQAKLIARKNDPSLLLRRPLNLPKISVARLEQLQQIEEQVESMKNNASSKKDVIFRSASMTVGDKEADEDVKSSVGRLVSKQV